MMVEPAATTDLVLSVQRRQAKGVTVQANYTLSHCISDLANPELAVAGQNYTIPDNRRYDRGNCPTSDRRHVFNVSTVYQTPNFANNTMRIVGQRLAGLGNRPASQRALSLDHKRPRSGAHGTRQSKGGATARRSVQR